MRLLPSLTTRLAATSACLLLASACTTSPQLSAVAVADDARPCDRIQAEVIRTEQQQQDALDRQQEAWRLVVPVAVAVRHASAGSDARKAGERLEALQAEARRQGCRAQG